MNKHRKERLLETHVCRHADALGIDHVKLNVWGRRGYMDRLFFIPGGNPLLMEFKDKDGQLSRLQQRCIDRLRNAGYDVHVVDDHNIGMALIDDRMNLLRLQQRIARKIFSKSVGVTT